MRPTKANTSPFRGRDPQKSPASFQIAAEDLEDQPNSAEGGEPKVARITLRESDAGCIQLGRRVVPPHCKRWRSKTSGKCSQERLTRGTVTSTMLRAAHPSGCVRCSAGAGCSTKRSLWCPPNEANVLEYRGTSLIRNRTALGTYSRPMPRFTGGEAFSYE